MSLLKMMPCFLAVSIHLPRLPSFLVIIYVSFAGGVLCLFIAGSTGGDHALHPFIPSLELGFLDV